MKMTMQFVLETVPASLRRACDISNVRCTPLATADCGAGTAPRYQVLDAADAVRLYENNYYQRVSDALYEQLLAAKQQIEEAVQPQDSTK